MNYARFGYSTFLENFAIAFKSQLKSFCTSYHIMAKPNVLILVINREHNQNTTRSTEVGNVQK